VRNYLTTLLWHEDRLSSLSSKYLLALGLLSTAAVALLYRSLIQFLDDLTFLLSENDLGTALVLLTFLLVISTALWVVSCCFGALARRALLRIRGL